MLLQSRHNPSDGSLYYTLLLQLNVAQQAQAIAAEVLLYVTISYNKLYTATVC